jgi:hypothetical protein
MKKSPQSERISVRVSGVKGTNYQAHPVTFGVPFGDGELMSGTPVALTYANGKSLPVQNQCLTTWSDDGKFVKWLLLDLQADLPNGGEKQYFLKFPAKKAFPLPGHTVQVDESEDFLTIDTGVMRLRIRRTYHYWKAPKERNLFQGCEVKSESGWRDVIRGNPGPFLTMEDQNGTLYDSLSAGPAPKVSVEESGPLRVCVRIDGFHATPQGCRMCPYTLRVHLFAGKSDLRIQHTFVFDQEPHDIELSGIGIRFPLDVGGEIRAAVGGDGESHFATNWGKMSLLQSDDQSYTVSRDGEAAGAGRRSPGWASLNGDRGGAVIVIKNAWQEYPKGFTLDQNGIHVEIWPRSHSSNLTFTTPFEEPPILFGATRDEAEVQRLLAENPTAPLNLKSFNIRSREAAVWVEKMLEKYAKNRIKGYNDTGTMNGMGAAKTTEIHLRLSGSAIDDSEADTFAQTANEPLVGIADPAHVSGSRALGHFFHSGDPRFAQADQDMENIYDKVVVEPIELCRLYGMMRYGNMVASHSAAAGIIYLLYKDSEPEKALRYIGPYNNEAVDQIMAVWGHFIRTGKQEHGIIAQNYSRCVADVGFTHAFPGHPEKVGLIHYHNVHPWSGGLSPSHSIVSGILTDYYLTGNRRQLDVAKEVADRIVVTQEPAGIVSDRRGPLHREFTGPLSILTDVYQATWGSKYNHVAERSLNWLLRVAQEPGKLPNAIHTMGEWGDEAVVQEHTLPEVAWGNKYHLYEPAVRLYPSKALKEFLIAEADYWVWESPVRMFNYQCTTVCIAYDLTGDVAYAAYATRLINEHFHAMAEAVHKGERIGFEEEWYSGFVPRLMNIVAEASDKDPDGFAAAAAAWWEKRRKMPDREETVRPDQQADGGMWISLGRLSTGPHGE